MPKSQQLTSKDLEIVSEMMLLEELGYKKHTSCAKLLKDTELQEQCKQLAANHKQRFTALNDYLNSYSS